MIPRLQIAVFGFVLLFSHHVSAQKADVRGIVSDSLTGERLPFANVTIRQTGRGAATNSDGFYLITAVPPGSYEIVASYLGYQPLVKRVMIQGPGPISVNFRLKPALIEMESVVVTAKRSTRDQISTSSYVLGRDDLATVPLTAQPDLFRSLQLLPGVVSTSDVSAQFYVRGGAGDQNLILLDGMKIYNPYHAMGLFSLFDPDMIRTAEVHLGAFPAGYGGRLSSVINLTTPSGRSDRLGGKASINLLSTSLRLEGLTMFGGDITWFAHARKSLFNATLKPFFGQDTPLSFYDAFFKVTIPGPESGKMSVHGLLSEDNMLLSDPDQPDYLWRNSAFGATFSGLIADRLYAEGSIFESRFTSRQDAKQSKRVRPAASKVRETGIRASGTLYGEAGNFYVFGLEMTFPTLEYTLVNRLGVPLRLYSVFPEGYSWFRYKGKFDQWQVDMGLHVDFASSFQRSIGWEIVQPRINASYELWPGWFGKASYGRFTQNLITVNNEDDVIALFDAWIRVPSHIGTEQSDHYVVGLDAAILPTLSMSVQSYYKNNSALVTYNRDKIDAMDPDYILGSGKAYGLEAMLRWSGEFIDVYAAYTLGWTTVATGGFTYYPRYDRRHSVKFLSVFRIAQKWQAVLRWDFGSGLPFTQSIGFYDRLTFGDIFRHIQYGETGSPYTRLGPKNAARLPVYHRLDASMGYEFRLGSITGVAGVYFMNLYNRKNIFYFDRKTGQLVNMLPFFPSLQLSLEY